MLDQELYLLSSRIGKILTNNELLIATAESCSGGLLAHILTGVSGSSNYYIGGVVAYSNPIKEAMLGVQSTTLKQYGAVSSQTAQEMAAGVCKRFGADIGLSTTGIAGPTGGTPEKPVGLVWIGISTQEMTKTFECHFDGGREEIKVGTVSKLLGLLLDYLKDKRE